MQQYAFSVKYMKDHNFNISNKTVCEFGVYSGNSMRNTWIYFKQFNIFPKLFLGFDSFEGLPESESIWSKGQYSMKDLFKTQDTKKIKDLILQKFPKNIPTTVDLIEGWFKNSLTPEIAQRIGKICWLDVDCDIYSSTKEILEFVFGYKLVDVNCLISYDDWGGTKEFAGGESLAHKEIAAKYKVNFEQIASWARGIHVQKVFIIRSLGNV